MKFTRASASIITTLGIATLAMLSQANASGGSGGLPTQTGILSARPAGPIGNWTIGGGTFVSSASTEFNFQFGALDTGVCAKVKYQTVSGINQAIQIESEPASDCGGSATPGGSGTPSATPSGTP